MENRDDRHWWNSITLQLHRETVDRMGHQCTHDHQGQSLTAHQQAEYRHAVHSTFPIASNTLAPPGESI
jgi:GTP-dependent phosphoenolpyruvate carboxykinase